MSRSADFRTSLTTPYRDLWADARLRWPLIWSVVARLPLYLTAMAILIAEAKSTGDYGAASVVLTGYLVGGAVFAPAVARWVDRSGQIRPLTCTALVHVATLFTLVLLERRSLVVAVALVGLAGASVPPVAACVRSLYGAPTVDETVRRAAYTVEAIVGEVIVICGPLLLSGFLWLSGATAAVMAGAALAASGAVGLALTSASRSHRSGPWTPGNLRGPLTAPGFRPLALVVLLAGAALGCYTVLVPAFTSEENRPELAGVLFAVWGLGSAVGGLWAGGRRPLPMSLERRFTLGLSMIAAGMAVPLLAHDVLTMAVALAIGGTVIAPATALQYQLIQQLTPPEHVTETFTWMMTANVAGAAVGAAVVGPVTDSGGSMIGFAIAFAVAVLTAITAWVCAPAWRRAIDRRPSNILSSGSVE